MLDNARQPQPQRSSSSPIALDAYRRAKRIKDNIAAGDKACTDAELYYLSAGRDLKILKETRPPNTPWPPYVRKMCNLGKTRANELIAMANGTPVAEVQAKAAKRQQKYRDNHREDNWPLRNGNCMRVMFDDTSIRKVGSQIFREQNAERKKKATDKILKTTNIDSPLVSERRYPVILADPPWRFDRGRKDGTGFPFSDRSPENHYPTMTHEEMMALPVANICTPDAILFMWSTNAHLAKAILIMQAWGFEYLTNLVWKKSSGGQGMGFYVRNVHEPLLIGRKGKMISPLPENRPPSVIEAPRTGHSEKPREVYSLIDKMYPDFQKIELFARAQHLGWDRWGNHKFAS
jgi:N6-adenosine-specific RNA methylase IME4